MVSRGCGDWGYGYAGQSLTSLHPARMAAGFPVAMTIAAGMSFAAALLAWTTIRDDTLSRSDADGQRAMEPLPPLHRHCAVAGTPLAASAEPPSAPRPPPSAEKS